MPDLWLDVDAAISEAPVNIMPLIDDTDFTSRETGITYDQAGMDLVWNFVTTAGAFTQTVVTPTTAGDYDWAHQGDGMYSIEITASGGADINNDTEGFGWFTGFATGVLPWRGPTIGFRAAGINNLLIDSAYSATRGMAGTALPDAAADAGGGLPISDTGGLDLDALDTNINDIETDTNELQVDWTNAGRLDAILDIIAADVVNLDGSAMIGTNNAALAATALTDVTWTDARAGYLDELAAANIPTDLDAVLADTNELQIDDIPGTLTTILADTNELQTDDVPALIAALNDLTAAAVNAEVVDVLNTDTFAEPTGVPAATVTLAAKIGFLYMALRNQVTVTATKKTFYDDGGAAEWEKDLSDDATTYTETEANAI